MTIMRNALIFILAAFISSHALPLVWQRGEFNGISWIEAVKWLINPSTYTAVLLILLITLALNYRVISILSTYANFCSGFVLGGTTAILFFPYDGIDEWHVALFGYEVGFMLGLVLLAFAIFLPVFLSKRSERSLG